MRPQLLDIEVRDADVANQTLVPELGKRAPSLLDVVVRDRPVDLVEVDRVDPQPLEAGMRLAHDRVPFEAVDHPTVRPLQQRGLGEHIRTLVRGEASQSTPDDLFGVTEPVCGSGIDPVHPKPERSVDRRDRLGVLLRTPAELPASSADCPGAEPDAGYLKAGVAELCGLQLRYLHCRALQ